MALAELARSLPHRQLRKLIERWTYTGTKFTAAQAAQKTGQSINMALLVFTAAQAAQEMWVTIG